MRKRANVTRILYYIGSLFSIEITAFYVVVSFFADLQDQRIADKLFKLLALDQFLCANEQNEGTVWFAQTIFDAVDSDSGELVCLLNGECDFEVDRNCVIGFRHMKASFLNI